VEAVAASYGLSVEDLLRRRDGAGFRAAAYLLRRAANLPLKQVAGMFGVSRALGVAHPGPDRARPAGSPAAFLAAPLRPGHEPRAGTATK
jgi:hypothetical protein